MKKRLRWGLSLLAAAILFSGPAAVSGEAEVDLTEYAITDGVIAAVNYDDLTAPGSGTLKDFDLEPGDRVQAGDSLFELLTVELRASEDGTVQHVFAEVGDLAESVTGVYGGVLAMSPERLKRISGTFLGASNGDEYHHLHIGETLYFRYGSKEGKGIVVEADSSDYVVEITEGDYNRGQLLDLFKTENYRSSTKVGNGKVEIRDDVFLPASGMVTEICVEPGDSVKKGDVLMRMLASDADRGAAPVIPAPADGVVARVAVAPGQQVWKGALLARVYREDELEAVVQADEMDLRGLKVGDRLPVTLDTDEETVLSGRVTEISALGVTVQNTARFTVHLALEEDGLMLGQSVSVYFPKQ